MEMKKTMKWALLSLVILCTPLAAEAQDEVEASVQADFLSKYMWRGKELGGISLQPHVGISWKGLSLSAMGSVGLDKDDPEEFDLELGYTLKGFNIGVIDYWNKGVDYEDRYFYYDRDEGAHTLEGNIGFTCKFFSLQAYTIFWGVDDTPHFTVLGFKTDHKRAYSTYIEAAVPFKLAGVDWELSAGMTPFKSAGTKIDKVIPAGKGESLFDETITVDDYMYADGPACVKAALRATKDLNLGDVSLPVFAEIHANPYMQKAYFMMGISVIPF